MTRTCRFFIICTVVIALSGCMPTFVNPFVDALISSSASLGVSAAQERGFAGSMKDAKIRMKIHNAWFRHDHTVPGLVDLHVYEGRVMLTGVVPSMDMLGEIVAMAWQPEGVKEVINEIGVAANPADMRSAHDSMIVTKMRSRLFMDGEIASINYLVSAVNRRLYILGVAKDEAERDRVVEHARHVAYVRRIISHIILKDDLRRDKKTEDGESGENEDREEEKHEKSEG